MERVKVRRQTKRREFNEIETTQKSNKGSTRCVLVIDSDEKAAQALKEAWERLKLSEELQFVSDRDEAMKIVRTNGKQKSAARMVGVVMDPETTGEETGPFLRELRKHFGSQMTPVVFWTRDGKMYEVLEGRGVESVQRKPAILRVIQALDSACTLKVRQPFTPYLGHKT